MTSSSSPSPSSSSHRLRYEAVAEFVVIVLTGCACTFLDMNTAVSVRQDTRFGERSPRRRNTRTGVTD